MTSVALVGCAHIHTPGFAKRLQGRDDVRVRSVWDHDANRAARWAKDLDSRPVADETAIWNDEAIDAVIICSETDRHEPLVLEAAAAGKHLFVEKPLGLGADDAFRMAKAIDQAGVLFQTGYFQRGTAAHQFVKAHVDAGHFGQITRLRHSNCHAGSLRDLFSPQWLWMVDPAQAGVGGFGDLGTHSLDIMMWLLGDVTAVTADIRVVTGQYGACDESGEGLLSFTNGAIGSLGAGWVDIAHPVNLILSGTEGHVYVRDGEVFFHSNHVTGADGSKPWADLPDAWPHAFELFLDAVGGAQGVPLVGVHEAAMRSAVMEAFYQAAQDRCWITPKRAQEV